MTKAAKLVRLFSAAVVITACSATNSLAIHAGDGSELTVIKESDIALSVRGSIMAVDGQSDEYVYAGHNNNGLPTDYKASELNWDISSLVMIGGLASLQMGNRIRVNTGLWVGVTEGDGGMDDYDWLNPSIPDWTHYSHSDIDIDDASSFDFNASFMFAEAGIFKFHGLLGYKIDYWEWTATGGTYIYSSDNGFRDQTGSFGNSTGIKYNQTFSIPYAGIKATVDSGRLHGSCYFLYSPFVYAEDEDHHVMRDLYFEEEFDNGDYYALGLEAAVDLTDMVFLSCALDFQDIPEFTGDMTVTDKSTGVVQHTEDTAGIGNSAAAFSISAGIRF